MIYALYVDSATYTEILRKEVWCRIVNEGSSEEEQVAPNEHDKIWGEKFEKENKVDVQIPKYQ